MLTFLIIRRLTGNLIIDLRNKVAKPVARMLVELAMHVHCIIQQLLALHLVKMAFVLNLTFRSFRRTPVGLVRNTYRDFNHNIRRASRLFDQVLVGATNLIASLRQIDY